MIARVGQVANVQLSLPQFPVDWIEENPALLEFFAKAVWALVPLQYYVLTHISGGLSYTDYVPAAVLALAGVFALSIIGSLIGLISHRSNREQHARAWGIALLLTWGASLGLLALAYALGPAFLYPATVDTNDTISHYLCPIWGCPNYPGFGLDTFFIYLIYSILAVAVIVPLIYRLGKGFGTKGEVAEAAKQSAANLNPNLLIVVLINASLLTLLSALTKY
jgi:hypothetical protein